MRPSKPRNKKKRVKFSKNPQRGFAKVFIWKTARFVVLLLAAPFSGRAPRYWIVHLNCFKRPPSEISGYCRRRRHRRRSIASSPGSPDRIGRLRGLPGGAGDTDGALRWRVHVLGHVGLARRRLSRRRLGRSRGGCRRRQRVLDTSRALESSQATAEVSHELRPSGGMNRRGDRRRQEGRHLLGALGEAVAEPVGIAVLRREREPPGGAQRVEMTYRQLEDVRLLQLGHVLALGLQRGHHQVLQLVQAAIDAGASLALQHRLHHLAVLIGARHRLLVFHTADRRVARMR